MTTNSMATICEGFATRELDSSSDSDVLAQLAVEGQRRIDAFVFELLFKQQLKKIACDRTGLFLAFGWHIGYDRDGEPAYWFRLMDHADDWNECDQSMMRALQRLTVGRSDSAKIVRVLFRSEENVFAGSIADQGSWEGWTSLVAVLDRLPRRGRRRDPRAMTNAVPLNKFVAFDWLQKPRLRHELQALSIQRRFMNCLLGPHLGRDGTDLDAMVKTPDGKLRCVEFKRKYPAMGEHKFFGLDVWPHVNTVRTLASIGIESLHVILVGPIWEKRQSPVGWLNDRSLDPHWTWLAASLDDQAFETQVLHTSGTDSGHRVAERDQRSIKWDRIRVLNAGLSFGQSGVDAFRRHLEDAPSAEGSCASYQGLYDRRAGGHPT